MENVSKVAVAPSTNPGDPPDWMLQEFDPNSVTIPCLRGILSEAGVCYNHVRLKAEFVVLLNSAVKPRAPGGPKDTQTPQDLSECQAFRFRNNVYLQPWKLQG
ncbi:hypothetical protein H4Q26_012670 [Puccinia striiformis f. sp. tritici PST-130]|nr:hypothetical protein H4Q26_012670 [Puccinia striiformis f. sp. tritici PST-130]